MDTATQQNIPDTTAKADAKAPEAQAKGAKAGTDKAGKAGADKAQAKALVAKVLAKLNAIRDEIASDEAGPLALREAAEAFGSSVSDEGRPSVPAWQTLGLIASAVGPSLRLRMEAADVARKTAKDKLRTKEKYAANDEALKKALDRVAKVTGKSASHSPDANVAVKFGMPAKVDGMF